MDEAIIERLREVGFSLYEARVYVTLVRGGSLNGNEVAVRASVPSGKVYGAIERLGAKGVVHSVRSDGSTRFVATPPSEVISRLRKQYNAPLDFLADELPKVGAAEEGEPFLTVSGQTALRAAAKAIVESANEDIHISCWEEELTELRDVLSAAEQGGVQINGMLYGEGEQPPGNWLRHPDKEIVGDRVGGRLLALVADGEEALIARVAHSEETIAVRSRNPVMTLVVQEYLRHDNLLQRAQSSLGLEHWDRWWRADPEARAEILGDAFRHLDDLPARN